MHPAQKKIVDPVEHVELEPSGTGPEPLICQLKNHRVLLNQLVLARSQWLGEAQAMISDCGFADCDGFPRGPLIFHCLDGECNVNGYLS